MVITSRENSISAWVFLVGVVLAICIGAMTALIPVTRIIQFSSPIYAILVLLGVFVGIKVDVSDKHSQTFLISSAVLVVVSKFGMESVIGSLIGIGIGDLVSSVFGALLVLFVPTTIVVALKTVFSMTKI
jgi:dolichol kinase